jgi:hypothetical protein
MLITAITLVSAAAMISGAGIALASSGAARARHETFRLVSTDENAKTQSVIATGAFVAGGYEVLGRTTDRAHLYRGSFEISRHVTHRTPPALPGPRCILRITERGTYRLSHGTGRYAGIRGFGNYTSRITLVLARTGSANCGSTVAFQQITDESGTTNK